MSVPEQIPYVGYVANGQTTEFPITFDLHDPEYLIVTVNKEIPAVGIYTVDMNALKVVFATAPTDGTQVEFYRETELNRDTNYQKYDNSFRPEAVNYDFDKIWHVLQEQDMIDAELLARLKAEIEWRRTHDANFDELAKMRDAQIFSGLKGYVDTLYSASNPNIFEGVTAGIVFALDKKSVQTHLEIIYEQLKNNHSELDERLTDTQIDLNNKVNEERNRAIGVEQSLQLQITTGNAGIKYFSTEAALLATTPGTTDPKQAYAFDTKKNYLWNGTSWT
ncbi:phage tail fiber protein, partial [Acinetobacter pittii]|nr:phage tail fiber protein [Acinetobacter pittii]MDX8265102.1 phage tail fiber protein [Acinetobacter pittii]